MRLWCVINIMADFLDEKKREIDARLKELRPLVDEFHRLEAAAAALDGVGVASGASAPARRGSRRAAASAASSAGSRRRGRPRGSGTRSKEALELVRTRPGITIPEIAEAMGIQQNYLYRVLPALQKDGLVRKEGRGWHPREAA
jgi:CRP-like cAMP-binding protein